MAYAKIVFQHPETGLTKEAPVGYSWTFLLFGAYVPLTRFVDAFSITFHIGWALSSPLTIGILPLLVNIAGSFVFNKQYIGRLIMVKGYRAKHAVALKENTPIPLEHLETSLNLLIPRISERPKDELPSTSERPKDELPSTSERPKDES